jgi:proton-translocating NADH-quinone oxidoreductase chain L
MELQGSALFAKYLLGLPLLASLLTAFLTRPWPLVSALVSWASTFGCLLISGKILVERIVAGSNPMSYWARPWLTVTPGGSSGLNGLPLGFMIDNLTAAMLVMVCFIALLIQIYSYSYISTEVHHFPTQGPTTVSRFFACLNLFIFAMLGLVLSVSTVQIYIFWELVGLCSYLLIGFWFFKTSAAVASRKAFVVTKFADLGFLLGVLCLGASANTFLFPTLLTKDLSDVSPLLLNLGLILLFCGAIGKSAQFPLHIWLPDAMEGPTPVSALIHAATMVAAGVYLVARTAPLFAQAPYAAMVVAWIGAITALVAASLALVQNDIKKILAYSTVSQLGFMVTALGAGATNAGTFHLITHAFFKALLFLGSGAVIVACHSNDIWRMGGLKKALPATHLAFWLGCLALAGIPPLAGFWSKDEILGGLTHQLPLLAILGFTALLTAFYVGRLYFVAFAGDYRGQREDLSLGGPVPPVALPAPVSPAKAAFEMQPFWSEDRVERDGRPLPPECLGALSEHVPHHSGPPHEVSPMMYIPLLILSVFAVFLGFIGVPDHLLGYPNYFADFVFPKAEHHPANWALMITSALIAAAGYLFAKAMYEKQPEEGERKLHSWLGRFLTVLQQKYYMDHFWAWCLTHLVYLDAKIVGRFDENSVDGAVYGVGKATYKLGNLVRQEQTGQLQRYALTLVVGLILLVFATALLDPEFVLRHLIPSLGSGPKLPGGQP